MNTKHGYIVYSPTRGYLRMVGLARSRDFKPENATLFGTADEADFVPHRQPDDVTLARDIIDRALPGITERKYAALCEAASAVLTLAGGARSLDDRMFQKSLELLREAMQ